MSTRERLEKILQGERPDRIPWIPRMKIWYQYHRFHNSLPLEYRECTLLELERELGLDHPARAGKIFKEVYHNVEIEEEMQGRSLIRHYSTPVGEVRELFTIDEKAKSEGLPGEVRIEHLIKDVEDYKVMEYILENREYIPLYEEFREYDKGVGDRGLPMVKCGYDPMFTILNTFIGYNRAYYELVDHKDLVLRLYGTLYEKQRELMEIMAHSPARVLLHGSHYDSQMTPPPIFSEFIKPYLKECSTLLHKEDKLLAVHADADSIYLLDLFLESGIDLADCLCTAPMVKCTIEDAIEAWGEDIIIYGGVPSVILCPISYSFEDFREYMKALFKSIRKHKPRFILGVSDNVMPQASLDRVKYITDMVESYVVL